ncbi:MAG: hypothetical protein JWQ49_4045 [Edaphobacter sp.]|nr:hypothetical protein [Edaphobacter sp.]
MPRNRAVSAPPAFPSVTQVDMDRILLKARTFYKNGFKSWNKFYDKERFQDQNGYVLAKHLIREQKGTVAYDQGEAIRPLTLHLSSDRYGDWLYENQITTGNCAEMSAIVIRNCRLLQGRCKAVYEISMDRPADHMFVLLSVNGNVPPWRNVSQMEFYSDTDNFWIIDCWLNIACQARYYRELMRLKLARWASQYKVVIAGGEVRNLKEPTFRFHLLYTPLVSRQVLDLSL